MPLVLFTAPAEEPVTLAEAKAHCRITHSDDDAMVTGLIVTARRWAEAYTRRAFVTQTWDWTLEAFPDSFLVPMPVMQSVTSIKYNDIDGVERTLATSEYTVDIKSQPARIVPGYNKSWPSTYGHINDVTVRFVAGYGLAAAVPQDIKNALLLIVAELYERRETAIVGTIITPVIFAAQNLLDFYRVEYRILNV